MDKREFGQAMEEVFRALGSDQEEAEKTADSLVKIFGEDIEKFKSPAKTTRGQFKLDQAQIEKADAWIAEHSKTCVYLGPKTADWFGSPLMYTFRPSGLGESVHLVCNCGQECDLTDYDNY